VHWCLVAAAFAGLLLGLRFRVPALLAATALVIGITAVAGGLAGVPRQQLLLSLLASVLSLQGAYLGGVLLAVVWRRIGSAGK
jgi:hypothetical protein